jgi:hypothetical protein
LRAVTPPPAPPDDSRWSSFFWSEENVAGAIYGQIIVMSVLVVFGAESDPTAGAVVVTVFVTSFVFWLAHVYAILLGDRIERQRRATWGEVRRCMASESPILQAASLPLLAVLLSLGPLTAEQAVDIGIFVSLAQLALLGFYAAYRGGVKGWGILLSGLTSLAFGLLIVLAKILVAH